MVRIPKIVYTFRRMGNEKLQSFTNGVIIALTNNANFPTLQDELAILNTAYEAYVVAAGNALQGSAAQRALRNEKKAELVALLDSMADHVMVVANGNRTKLVSSGFRLNNENNTPSLVVIEDFRVYNGTNSGEMITEAKVQDALTINVYHTADPITPDSDWKLHQCSTRKCIITNLEQGQKRWYKISVTGHRNQVVESAPVMGIAV
jgi:hypothetical protein